MPVDNDQVAQISELLGSMSDDDNAHEGGNPPTDGPETAQDLFGDQSGDSQDTDTADPEPVEGETEGGEEGDPEGTGETEAQTVTVKQLAEQLGLEAKDLYNELEIPLGDGQTTTLGEWKDRVKDLAGLDDLRSTYEQESAQATRQRMQERAEMQHVLSLLPEAQREQLIRAGAEMNRAYIKQQEQEVLQAIPEWSDPDTLAKDRDAIILMGSEYGFSEPEITSTHDARTLRMVHDMAKMKARLDAIDAESKRQTKKAPGKPGTTRKQVAGKLAQAITRAKQSGDARDAEAAVAQLIRGQR